MTQYFLTHYKIDPSKVYINGYSGGGESLSLVLAKQPELYTAALMCSSQWDGEYDPVVKAKITLKGHQSLISMAEAICSVVTKKLWDGCSTIKNKPKG